MTAVLDALVRAAAYCLLPRVIVLSLMPLVLMLALAYGLAAFFWTPAVQWLQTVLAETFTLSDWLAPLWSWLPQGQQQLPAMLAPLLVALAALPLVVVASLLAVAVWMAPSAVTLVSQRRFVHLQRREGASFWASALWSLGHALMALVLLVLSLPLWLIPPLVLVLPPLIWGWMTYRVMAFDALAAHASAQERQTLLRRHRLSLLGMGVVSGLLGAAPGVVWASGVVFVAAFFVLIPLALWIYTLVFVFSCLWFTHYCLAALQQLRAQPAPQGGATPPGGLIDMAGPRRNAFLDGDK